MTENRLFAGWLRSLTGLAAVAGILALSACGGGSGAPNNVFKSAFTVLPSTGVVAYSGVPMLLTITGGAGPFQAFSSNPGVLPVAQNVPGRTILLLASNVASDADVSVNITVQDLGPLSPAAPSQTVAVTVRESALVNGFTIVPALADCGTSLCSGQTATAQVTLRGTQGDRIAGRAIRFDVIGTAYAIVTNNPAQPLASSLTVVDRRHGDRRRDHQGERQRADAGRADERHRRRDGAAIGRQLHDRADHRWDGDPDGRADRRARSRVAFKGVCSTGFATDYYIYGGTPPYRVTSTFPTERYAGQPDRQHQRRILRGDHQRHVRRSADVLDPRRDRSADDRALHNVEGTEDAPTPTPPAALAVSPTTVTNDACTGKTFTFFAFGGTPPYNVRPSSGTASPQTVATAGGNTRISGLTTGSGDTTILFLDASSPQKSASATITCSAAPALSAEPPSVSVPAPSAGPRRRRGAPARASVSWCLAARRPTPSGRAMARRRRRPSRPAAAARRSPAWLRVADRRRSSSSIRACRKRASPRRLPAAKRRAIAALKTAPAAPFSSIASSPMAATRSSRFGAI